MVFRNIFNLVDFLTVTEAPAFWLENSLIVVPDKYDTNAGIIGRMHGEKNEPAPASADTKMLASTNSRKELSIFGYLLFSRSIPNLRLKIGEFLEVFNKFLHVNRP